MRKTLLAIALLLSLASPALAQLGGRIGQFRPVWTIQVHPFDAATTITVGDGVAYFVVPEKINGTTLIGITAQVVTASSSGAVNIDLARCATVATGNMCSGTVDDVLSTNLTIDSGENKSSTAAAAAVINAANAVVQTDQVLRVDVDGAGTGTKGLIVTLNFQ